MKRASLKHWLSYLFYGSQEIEILAGDIARQCRGSLLQRVLCRSHPLSPEQIRGYARAYANRCLEPTLQEWISTDQPDHALISKVVSQAREILIEMVVRDMQETAPPVVADIASAA